MNNISAVILTHNNEDTIEKCLHSLISTVKEILIIDDYSKDKTLEICKKFNCKIYKRELNHDFSAQRNFGIEKVTNEYVLTLDSDEELNEDLINSIKEITLEGKVLYTCDRSNKNFCGSDKVHLKRRPIIMHKSYRFIGSLHEYVKYRHATKIKGFIIHNSWISIEEFMNDINVYSSNKALDWYRSNRQYSLPYLLFRQTLVFIYQFLYRYFIEMRLRHGVCGFLYCLFWASEELAVGLKYMELKRND